MALFNRQKNSNVPVELQPYYDAPRSGPRGWLIWIVRVIALVIVIGALGIGAHWGWQKIVNNDKKVGIATTQKAKAPATKQPSSPSSSSSSSQGSVTPSDDSAATSSTTTPATSSTSSTSSTSDQSAATPGTLVNTGPGETVAMFGLVTVAGIAVYQVFLRFKQRVNL